jgi:hypothetical protein
MEEHGLSTQRNMLMGTLALIKVANRFALREGSRLLQNKQGNLLCGQAALDRRSKNKVWRAESLVEY